MIQFFSGLGLGLGITAVVFFIYRERVASALKMAALEKEARERFETELKATVQTEFKAAAADSLERASRQYLDSALKDLRQVKTEIALTVDEKKQDISASVHEMKSRLDSTEKLVRQFEMERSQLYGQLEQSLTQVLNAEQAIRIETTALKRVLTSGSGVRGKWGEKILQEILEQNDFVRGIHFDVQVSLEGDEKDVRPDFVLFLPEGHRLAIDSKEVAGEYVLAQETDDPEAQKEHYLKLVANIRGHFVKLSRKEYQSHVDAHIPFVIMFIPSEAAIRAAFATDPGIFEEATQRKVILASPMTIIPLIYLIRHSWQQHRLADNARDLGVAVEELGNRLAKFVEHLQSVRGGISKAADSWDRAMASWQTRVTPQREKIKLLGGRLRDHDELEQIGTDYEESKKKEST